jgi:Uma2 family endonuclease
MIALLQPPPTQPPARHRWTIEQYRRLGEQGWFPNRKTILIHGEIFTMVMANPPHDVALGLTDDWLRSVFGSGYSVRNQMGFDIGQDTDPGPDLAVVRGQRRDYIAQAPREALLIVEVAESSLAFDTTTKAELYAIANVPEYWVLVVLNRVLHVFRDPQPLAQPLGATAYRSHVVLKEDEQVSPLLNADAVVKVKDLLP